MTGYDGVSDVRQGARVLLIADGKAQARDGAEALATFGAIVEGPVSFDEAPARLSDDPLADLVLIEAGGVVPALLDPTVDAVAAIEARGVPLIVTLEQDQIDDVAGRCLTGRVQLLCAPSHRDRIVAIAVAMADRRPTGVREEDDSGEQLRRLNAEVARIVALLTRLTDGEPIASRREMLGDRTIPYRAESKARTAISASEVRQAIRMRRLRDQFFDTGLFEDPAWDMLLDLFAAELEQSRVSVSSLCIAAAVAPTTALRWIGRMTEIGLFDRVPDPADRRRAFMVLAPKAAEGMREYCAAVKRAGGTIG